MFGPLLALTIKVLGPLLSWAPHLPHHRPWSVAEFHPHAMGTKGGEGSQCPGSAQPVLHYQLLALLMCCGSRL